MVKKKEIESKQIRFFVGYAGWDPKQLDKEMKDKSWIITDTNPSIIMNPDTDELWAKVIKLLGGEYTQMANYPEDPQLN